MKFSDLKVFLSINRKGPLTLEDPDTLKSAATEGRLLYLQQNFAQADDGESAG